MAVAHKNTNFVEFKSARKPRDAFADGSWKDPKTEGPLGQIRWRGMSTKSVAAYAGVNRGDDGKMAVTPLFTGTTPPTLTCDELGARFADTVHSGRTGMIYPRLGSEDTFELECALVGVHGSFRPGDAMVFGSGMAAISHALLPLLTAGDNLVSHKNLYGCTDNLLRIQLPNMGFATRYTDFTDPKNVAKAIDNRTRAVYFETPSNPVLDLIDIAKVVEATKGRCPVIVDNTFASPLGQNPFEQGAHIVIYSLTKSIGGHADAIGGAVLGSGTFLEHLFYIRKDFGGIMAAREATEFVKGIHTLPLRYRQMQKNAKLVARMLRGHTEISRVYYPEFDRLYPLGGQMKGPGYMIAFELKKGLEGAKKMIDGLQMIVHAVSLGGVFSLISNPASSTHFCVGPEQRMEAGISDGLVRISVGVENVGEVIGDLKQALAKVKML